MNTIARTQKYKYKNTFTCDFLCLVVEPLSKAWEGETGRAGRVRCFNGEPYTQPSTTKTRPRTVTSRSRIRVTQRRTQLLFYALYQSSSEYLLIIRASLQLQCWLTFFSCLGFGNVILAGGIFFRCHTNKAYRIVCFVASCSFECCAHECVRLFLPFVNVASTMA